MRLCLFLVFLFTFVATPVGPAMAATRPVVFVSIAPQKWLVETIAGNAVTVRTLAAPGADPHSYEPTPQQMRELLTSSVYLTAGVPFEAQWLPRLNDPTTPLNIRPMTLGIPRLPLSDHDEHGHDHGHGEKEHGHAGHDHAGHDHGDSDPHVWLSPANLKHMAAATERELLALLPEKATEFSHNRALLDARLAALDAELKTLFASAPSRVFLTFHPSWRYFAEEYGLTELSIEHLGKEPGPRAMKGIIDRARAHKISVVFIEPQFPRAAALAVAANINARVVQVDPLAEKMDEELMRFARELARSWQQ